MEFVTEAAGMVPYRSYLRENSCRTAQILKDQALVHLKSSVHIFAAKVTLVQAEKRTTLTGAELVLLLTKRLFAGGKLGTEITAHFFFRS